MRFTAPKLVALLSLMVMLLVAAVPSVSAQTGWQMGPGAILDNTYDGFIDAPQNGATIPAGGSFAVWRASRTTAYRSPTASRRWRSWSTSSVTCRSRSTPASMTIRAGTRSRRAMA